jgi:hypothetical protein
VPRASGRSWPPEERTLASPKTKSTRPAVLASAWLAKAAETIAINAPRDLSLKVVVFMAGLLAGR